MNENQRQHMHAAASIKIVDGVLVFAYVGGTYVDETVARSVIAAATELAGELAPMPTLVLLDKVKGTSKGARDFFASSPENAALSNVIRLVR